VNASWRAQIETCGIARVAGIYSAQSLLDLALSIGKPIPSPTGELVKRVTIKDSTRARVGTLSAAYGDGQFPLHTDTAFWPVPARYIVMRVAGDTRRCTTFRRFDHLLRQDAGLQRLVEKSVWLVRAGMSSFYCSMTSRQGALAVGRYDANCMVPANSSAGQALSILRNIILADGGEPLGWSPTEAIIISNWDALHGRGPAPKDEGHRILERIYVR
jgi:hypothetical protein